MTTYAVTVDTETGELEINGQLYGRVWKLGSRRWAAEVPGAVLSAPVVNTRRAAVDEVLASYHTGMVLWAELDRYR
jgi:hypothetical protein